MKIVANGIPVSNKCLTALPRKEVKPDNRPIKCGADGFSALANYNLAFRGLNDNDTVYTEMTPMREYNVYSNSKILLGKSYILDLSRKDIREKLSVLPEEKELVIGRGAYLFDEFKYDVSNRHIGITKHYGGKLTARDLGSKYGSYIIEEPIEKPHKSDEPIELERGKKYVISLLTKLRLGSSYELDLMRNDVLTALYSIPRGDKLIIGRAGFLSRETNKYPDVSRKHLSLSRNPGGGIIVEDLNSSFGTYVYAKNKPKEAETAEKPVKEPPIPVKYKFESGKNYLIPPDSIIKLVPEESKDVIYLSDYREQIGKIKPGGSIMLGKSEECDIIINYRGVSRRQILIGKDINSRLYLRDLASTNGTAYVGRETEEGDKYRLAFPYGAENIEFFQSDIGDCYLLASLYALSRTFLGAKLLEKTVTFEPGGVCRVKFPRRAPVDIKICELQSQIGKGDEVKLSVSGDTGVKAIERAYGRLIKKDDFEYTLFAELNDGGLMKNAIKTLTGLKTEEYTKNLLKGLQKAAIIPKSDRIVTAGTKPNKCVYVDYNGQSYQLPRRHAFAVGNIDTGNKTLELINPHDTTKPFYITWSDFEKYFNNLTFARI